MFVYCNNNAIMLLDPSGRSPIDDEGFSCGNSAHAAGTCYHFRDDPLSWWEVEEMGFVNVDAGELNLALRKNEITTPERIAHFMSQCAVESRFGKDLIEKDWGSGIGSLKNGNILKYIGAGYIQLSYYYNYRAFADFMGNEKIYELGATYVAANYAWDASAWWWTHNGMNALIDRGANSWAVSGKVYGRDDNGTFAQREEYYYKFLNMLN